jgi:hypothetical protein
MSRKQPKNPRKQNDRKNKVTSDIALATSQLNLFRQKYDDAFQILMVVESTGQRSSSLMSGQFSDFFIEQGNELLVRLRSIAELGCLHRNLRRDLAHFCITRELAKHITVLSEVRKLVNKSHFGKLDFIPRVEIEEADYFGALEFAVLIGESTLSWIETHLIVNRMADKLSELRNIPSNGQSVYKKVFRLSLGNQLPNEAFKFPINDLEGMVAVGRRILADEKASLSNHFDDFIQDRSSNNESMDPLHLVMQIYLEDCDKMHRLVEIAGSEKTVPDKLIEMQEILPIPSKTPTKKIAETFGRSRQAIQKSQWFKKNRGRGEKE